MKVAGLHGIGLLLDSVSIAALSPWLDATPPPESSPIVEVTVQASGELVAPAVLEVVAEQLPAWLGRTASGLVLRGAGQSWFAIDGCPAAIRGSLGVADDAAEARNLLLGALRLALSTIGVHALHAAAVCTDERAIVLLGDSGAGKSTTTTALVSAGCSYLGDDELLIRERTGSVELLSHWPSFRLTEQVLASFANLQPHLSKVATDAKWSLDAAAAFPRRRRTNWLGATTLLFLARSSDRSSTLSKLTLAQATGQLIAQSYSLTLEVHPNPRQHLDLLALLASRAHVAQLELGYEWLEDPIAAARRLLDLVCSSASSAREAR